MTKLYQGQLSVIDEVYNHIIALIADGKWKVGDKLPSEKALCDLFSVSRVSVRAAIQRQKGQGFIMTRHSVGSFVTTPPKSPILTTQTLSDITGSDYLELFEFRQAIELRAIDLFAIRANAEDKERLCRAADGMTASIEDLHEFTRWDMEYHEAIFQGAHNRYLQNVFLAYKEAFFHYLEEINRLSHFDLRELAANHRRMYEDLLKRRIQNRKRTPRERRVSRAISSAGVR